MKNKNLRGTMVMMCLAMLAAVAVMVAAVWQRNSLQKELESVSAELAASQAAWQQTAADKEALEAERDQLTADLREAQTTLEESEAKNTELTAQIEELKTGNADLNAQISAANETLTAAQTSLEQTEALTASLTAAESDKAALKQELITVMHQNRDYLAGQVEAAQSRISALTTGGDADPEEIQAAWAEEEALSSRLAAVDSRLAVLESEQ